MKTQPGAIFRAHDTVDLTQRLTPDPKTVRLIEKALEQNKMILEANVRLMGALSAPPSIVSIGRWEDKEE